MDKNEWYLKHVCFRNSDAAYDKAIKLGMRYIQNNEWDKLRRWALGYGTRAEKKFRGKSVAPAFEDACRFDIARRLRERCRYEWRWHEHMRVISQVE